MEDDNYCFCCGEANPQGLHLDIQPADGGHEVRARFITPPHLQGYKEVVHGGILATLLDELMAHAAIRAVPFSVATARMEISFRRPARVGVPLEVIGRVASIDGRRVTTAGVIKDESDQILAEATALFLRVRT